MTLYRPKSFDVLLAMYDGSILASVLGADPLKPNKRTFTLQNGQEVSQYAVTAMLRHELIKVIRDDGPRRYYVITERGRAMAARHATQSGSHPQRRKRRVLDAGSV